MPKYLVIHDSRQTLEVEADDPNQAVRIARDAPLTDWQLGDQDEIELYDEEGEEVEFDWSVVEELLGT